MTVPPDQIDALFAGDPTVALVRVETARGSTPREAGAWMLVTADAMLGTIGGGQLEYMALDAARAMLSRGEESTTLDVPLGPEIGQCCGGRALLAVRRLIAADRKALRADAEAALRALPAVHVFGAGHVGRALAATLALLPVRPFLVDGRPEELALAPAGVETLATPLPEAVARDAPPGSAFVILTHDHALDFLIAREALARTDAAYVGMIGSRSKRASFLRWLRETEDDRAIDPARLVCPIGAGSRPDKRPEVIAAFVATEIMQRLAARQVRILPIRSAKAG
jgi:xanthine dehydrogenase accessory factor